MFEATVESRIEELFAGELKSLELSSLPYRKNIDSSSVAIILRDLNAEKINFKEYSLAVVDKLLFTDRIQSKEEKSLMNNLEVLYKTVIVLYMSYLPKSQPELYQSAEQLLLQYPEFCFDKDCENDLWYDLVKESARMKKKRMSTEIEGELLLQHSAEVERLLIFRNFMRLCLVVIPPEGNKNILLKVAAKLEGAGQSYITGGDPRPATRRRIRIYERESGIKAKRKNSTGNTFNAITNVSSFPVLHSTINANNLLLLSTANCDGVRSASPFLSGAEDEDPEQFTAAAAAAVVSTMRRETSLSAYSPYNNMAINMQNMNSNVSNSVQSNLSNNYDSYLFNSDSNVATESPLQKKVKSEFVSDYHHHSYSRPLYSCLHSGEIVDLRDLVIPEVPVLECERYPPCSNSSF